MNLTDRSLRACLGLALAAYTPAAAAVPPGEDVGPFVRALWLVQRRGTPEATDPARDTAVKGRLFKALGKDGVLTATGLRGLVAPEVFARFAGPDGRLDSQEVRMAVESDVPESRARMLPGTAEHLDDLSITLDQIGEAHRAASAKLAEWIASNYRPGQPMGVICVCTGNSRRSILGATMGNLAASYVGLPEVRFFSGGTQPSAFNPRTIGALRGIGVSIEPTGEEAPRGEPGTENPVYRVRWGSDPSQEAREFSKLYSDTNNPQSGFAALMVCGEADESCPAVRGASARISTPYLDPKIFDGSAYEAAQYAERRDDMGRAMLSSLIQARSKLAEAGRLP